MEILMWCVAAGLLLFGALLAGHVRELRNAGWDLQGACALAVDPAIFPPLPPPSPAIIDPGIEAEVPTARWSLVPFGLECRWDLGSGTTTISPRADWRATALACAAVLAAAAGLRRVTRPRQRSA